MAKGRTIICFFLIISSFTFLSGQQYSFSIAAFDGLLIPHNYSVLYLNSQGVRAINAEFSSSLYKNSLYSNIYRNPEAGIGFFASNLGKNSILGNSFSGYSFFYAPLIRRKYKFIPGWKIAIGYTHITKLYDMNSNYRNIAIGTHGNVYFNIGLDLRYNINAKTSIYASYGITHFSNGNIKKPNLGVNVAGTSVGCRWSFFSQPLPASKDSISLKRYSKSITFVGGARSYNMFYNSPYPSFSLVGDVYRQFNPKRKWGLGFDVFYSQAFKPILVYKGYGNVEFFDKVQAGVHGGYALCYNKLSLIIHMGYYVYAKYKEKPIYSRYGLRYAITDKILLNFSLKAHLGVADYVEYGIGYAF